MHSPDTIASALSETRLWQRLMSMAEIGAIDGGGVNRQALTDGDAAAQQLLVRWAEARNFACSRDGIGNLFIRRHGTEPELAPVMTGSHLDTQPTGGKFDGAYGVMAGFEFLEALEDTQTQTRRPIDLVAWMNEEGCRFQPGAMGSGVYGGSFERERMLERYDRGGVLVRDALDVLTQLAPLPAMPVSPPPACYVEAHIEQGPLLEEARMPVGIVTGIQGIRRIAVEILGREAHAGTTPRRMRQDALSVAAEAIYELERRAADPEDMLRFTVGSLNVLPNSTNTVPSRVDFLIDLRHPSEKIIQNFSHTIETVIAHVAKEKRCSAMVNTVSHVAPTVFDSDLVKDLQRFAGRLGYAHMPIASGAGHDSMHVAKRCPTAMVFVPCRDGVSHHPSESAEPADLIAGARLAAAVLLERAQA